MKTIAISIVMALFSLASCASNAQKAGDGNDEPNKPQTGEVVVMNKALFISNVFDFEHSTEWKYAGKQPAIIDLYADWCAPCRQIAPIMKELAKEYDGKVIFYKVNVDNEKDIARYFRVSSIPMLMFIPMNGAPQSVIGSRDKATYKQAIDSILLNGK